MHKVWWVLKPVLTWNAFLFPEVQGYSNGWCAEYTGNCQYDSLSLSPMLLIVAFLTTEEQKTFDLLACEHCTLKNTKIHVLNI